jgi:hypothetical protein
MRTQGLRGDAAHARRPSAGRSGATGWTGCGAASSPGLHAETGRGRDCDHREGSERQRVLADRFPVVKTFARGTAETPVGHSSNGRFCTRSALPRIDGPPFHSPFAARTPPGPASDRFCPESQEMWKSTQDSMRTCGERKRPVLNRPAAAPQEDSPADNIASRRAVLFFPGPVQYKLPPSSLGSFSHFAAHC